MTSPADYNAREFAAGRLTWEQITAMAKAYQSAHGLDADGAIGPATRKALDGKVLDVSSDLPAEAIPVRDVLARCRAAMELVVDYELGHGGRDPRAASPADANGQSDCSGFTAWACHHDRRRTDGTWVNTDSVERDARTEGGDYDRILVPRPGCLIVYGAGPKVGHIGIVSQVLASATGLAVMTRREVLKAIRVIHCASGNRGRTSTGKATAIRETDGVAFGGDRDDCCFALYRGVDYSAV